MSEVSTAVILAAGFGTRRLPITKSVEKCMLPVGNRPLIDYAVADAAMAGIRRIIFVVGEQSDQIRSYYGSNRSLEEYLQERGKTDMLDVICNTGHGLDIEFVVQPADGRYGTAVPLHVVAPMLEGEQQFMVLGGDDFTYRKDSSDLQMLADTHRPGEHAMLAATVMAHEISNFGILETDRAGFLTRVLEKPEASSTDSRLINISKYVFDCSLLAYLNDYMDRSLPEGQSEYYLTDVYQQAIDDGRKMQVVPAQGMYLDGGTTHGWLHANQVVIAGL